MGAYFILKLRRPWNRKPYWATLPKDLSICTWEKQPFTNFVLFYVPFSFLFIQMNPWTCELLLAIIIFVSVKKKEQRRKKRNKEEKSVLDKMPFLHYIELLLSEPQFKIVLSPRHNVIQKIFWPTFIGQILHVVLGKAHPKILPY